MPFTDIDDLNVIQGSDTRFISAYEGHDTYVINPQLMDANQSVTILDSGSNTLHLAAGAVITASQVTSDGFKLTFDNGANITLLDASDTVFKLAGDTLTGNAAQILTFSQFVSDALGVTELPLDQGVVSGSGVTITEQGLQSDNNITLTPEPTGDGSVVASFEISQQITSGYEPDYEYSGDYRKDALLEGSMWGYGPGQGVELTYSFPDLSSQWVQGYGHGEPLNQFTALNTIHQQGVRAALEAWSDVANVRFTEITETSDTVGDLRFGFSAEVSGNTAGWAYTPSISYVSYAYQENTLITYEVLPSSGDIWLNPNSYQDTDWLAGSDNYHTLAHEIGHALGLKHPFESDGNGTMLTGDEDSYQYSIMSYTGYDDMGSLYTDNGGGHYSFTDLPPSSPMLYDILAIQYLYGENLDANKGNDTYQFSSDAPFMEVIWDAGGVDTLDASNQSLSVDIDLNEGAWSSLGIRYLDYQTPSSAYENLAIAYGVEIENAVGSDFNDTLTGNALNNYLTGGTGDDLLSGGDGIDTAIFSGNFGDYTITNTGASSLQVTGMDGTDILNNIEFVQFDDQTVNLLLFG